MSKKLMGYYAPSSLFSSSMGGAWASKSSFPQGKLARDPTLYILILLGTYYEKRQGAACSDSTDPYYFENDMKTNI